MSFDMSCNVLSCHVSFNVKCGMSFDLSCNVICGMSCDVRCDMSCDVSCDMSCDVSCDVVFITNDVEECEVAATIYFNLNK